ncbi:hypothetical protein JMJ35_002747 [Cladonia borealis]|uniref:Uncharacterized protein n=1 Tax=Cladonia borealis TaxID=184061 RepID=A0AA39V440_9LECA|nr:hypothetical protein JMJ35_002747 [Cladonia borealis]
MGPLPSFITSCRASALGRPFTFGNYFPTKWFPARPMKIYSSPLTIKPARSASGAVFSYNNRYATVDRNPRYQILLGYASDEPSDPPLNSLRSFRQAMHQALYIHDRRRVRSLSTIKYIFKLYTALLGQGTLEPVDTLTIARLLLLTLNSQPPSIAMAISRYISLFASHYVTKVYRLTAKQACGDSVDFGLKSDLTKAMLEAILVFVNIKGARLDGRHLECLIRGFLSMLPRQGLESMEIDNKLDTPVSSFLSYLKGWFLIRGFEVDIEIYVTVISWSRKLRNKFLFEWPLNELRSMGQNVTAPSLRAEYSPPDGPLYLSLLIAAGEFRLPEMVKIAWEFLARCFWRTRFGPSLAHWRHFAAAAKRTGLVPYYNLQLDLFVSKGKIGAPRARKADYVSGVRRNDPSYEAMHAENPDIHTAVEAFVQSARAIVGDFDSATSKGANHISLIRFSIWRWPATVPEEWQRRLYDDLSSKSGVELSAVSVLYKDEKTPKSLGVSYRELRYRSWKTINNLLLQAEAFESRNDSRDLSGHSHPVAGFQKSMKNGYARLHHLPWLLEHLDDIEKESNKQYSEEEWREKILNLRSPNYRSP